MSFGAPAGIGLYLAGHYIHICTDVVQPYMRILGQNKLAFNAYMRACGCADDAGTYIGGSTTYADTWVIEGPQHYNSYNFDSHRFT